jgi:hypothetical protein
VKNFSTSPALGPSHPTKTYGEFGHSARLAIAIIPMIFDD